VGGVEWSVADVTPTIDIENMTPSRVPSAATTKNNSQQTEKNTHLWKIRPGKSASDVNAWPKCELFWPFLWLL